MAMRLRMDTMGDTLPEMTILHIPRQIQSIPMADPEQGRIRIRQPSRLLLLLLFLLLLLLLYVFAVAFLYLLVM